MSGFGSFLKAVTSHIPVVGEVAGPLLGAAMGAAHGGGWKGALKGAAGLGAAAVSAAELAKNVKGANADSKTAHGLADRSTELANQASASANKQYGLNSPLRDAFRFGAMNFGDPTNPFDRSNQFAQFRAGLQQENAVPAGAAPAGGLGAALRLSAPAAPAAAPVQRNPAMKLRGAQEVQ